MSRLVIGIAGGTGSGKTTVASNIVRRLELDAVTIIQQDAYYRDLADLAPMHRETRNFDHPDSIEHDLFARHVAALKAGEEIEHPVYDFTRHVRKRESVRISPRDVIIAEGILLFHLPEVRGLLDIKIYVDTPADIRLLRRITRDIRERGRTLGSVTEQYLRTVRPMHEEFVEPSKRHADVIIPEGGYNEIAIDMIASRIRQLRAVAP
ncbi:MAG TPA: uridine kinase [Gemmatimonadota bacterium]|nr:uridine kinase [Gemmatimonadota bacterium]